MQHVIEYVGREGVITTPLRERLHSSKPRPGDFVRWSEHDQDRDSACKAGAIGRIWLVGGGYVDCDEAALICVETGSAFLTPSGVDISGGPFVVRKLSELVTSPVPDLHCGTFWNWGDNPRGAGMGVEYRIVRPVWTIENGES